MNTDIKMKLQEFQQLTALVLKATNLQDVENMLDALVEHARETYNTCLYTLGPNDAITQQAFIMLKKAIIIAESGKGKEQGK